MGLGFVCVVPASQAVEAVRLLDAHHPGTAPIGVVTHDAGTVRRSPAQG
jgi:phosphoribosylaminoimidazole (AIR) synthetase